MTFFFHFHLQLHSKQTGHCRMKRKMLWIEFRSVLVSNMWRGGNMREGPWFVIAFWFYCFTGKSGLVCCTLGPTVRRSQTWCCLCLSQVSKLRIYVHYFLWLPCQLHQYSNNKTTKITTVSFIQLLLDYCKYSVWNMKILSRKSEKQ